MLEVGGARRAGGRRSRSSRPAIPGRAAVAGRGGDESITIRTKAACSPTKLRTRRWERCATAGTRADRLVRRRRVRPEIADQAGETLHEHLLWQLEMEHFTPREVAIGAGAHRRHQRRRLPDRSHWRTFRRMLPAERRLHPARSRADARQGAALDPAGVGARDLAECLRLQLRQLDPTCRAANWPCTIAASYLDLVADQELAMLRRELGAIATRNSRMRSRWCAPATRGPGAAIQPTTAEYVVPDVFVRKHDGAGSSKSTAASPPRLRVNQAYAEMLARQRRARRPAHAAAGGALAGAQPGDPQRHAAEGRQVHRRAPDGVSRAWRRGHETDGPAGRRRSRRNARIDDFPGHHQQIHAHAARRVRASLFLLQPGRRRRRHRAVLDGHPRQDPQADRAGEPGQPAERQPHRRVCCRTTASTSRGAPWQSTASRMKIAPSSERKRRPSR